MSPITTATGQRVGVTVFGRGITARKQIEAALRTSEARYRLLSEHSADVIWTMDLASFRFTYVSPSVQRLRGYTVEEVLAQPVEAALTPESNLRITSQLSARLAAFLAGDEAARTAVTEVDQPCKDGAIVPTEAVYTPLRHRTWLGAVVASNTVGVVVDSALFLWLAFGSLNFLVGQIVGKLWMTALAVVLILAWRRLAARPAQR